MLHIKRKKSNDSVRDERIGVELKFRARFIKY